MEEEEYSATDRFMKAAKKTKEEEKTQNQVNEKRISQLSVRNGLIVTVIGGVIVIILTLILKSFGVV